MGYFSCLYLIKVKEIDRKQIEISTCIMEGQPDRKPYFSWVAGERSSGLKKIDNASIYSNVDLVTLPGYPITEKQIIGNKTDDLSSSYLIEANFVPEISSAGTMLHVELPPSYIPVRNYANLIQPTSPFVKLENDQLRLAWASEGSINVKFCIMHIGHENKISDFPLDKILTSEGSEKTKFGMEINLGFVKFKFN